MVFVWWSSGSSDTSPTLVVTLLYVCARTSRKLTAEHTPHASTPQDWLASSLSKYASRSARIVSASGALLPERPLGAPFPRLAPPPRLVALPSFRRPRLLRRSPSPPRPSLDVFAARLRLEAPARGSAAASPLAPTFLPARRGAPALGVPAACASCPPTAADAPWDVRPPRSRSLPRFVGGVGATSGVDEGFVLAAPPVRRRRALALAAALAVALGCCRCCCCCCCCGCCWGCPGGDDTA